MLRASGLREWCETLRVIDMTLIVGVITPHFIALGSDKRLTYEDGTLYDEGAVKMIVLECADAKLGLAYTGRAMIGTELTDRWITRNLREIDATGLTIVEAMRLMARRLTDAFVDLPDASRLLILLGAGYHRDHGMFKLSIYNECSPQVEGGPQTVGEFQIYREVLNQSLAYVFAAGAVAALPESYLARFQIVSEAAQRGSQPFEDFRDYIVSIIRESNEHVLYGNRVGRECIMLRLDPNGGTICSQHSEVDNANIVGPHHLSPRGDFWGIRIWAANTPPPPEWSENTSNFTRVVPRGSLPPRPDSEPPTS